VRDDDELNAPHLLLLLCVLETNAVMRHWSWRSLDGGTHGLTAASTLLGDSHGLMGLGRIRMVTALLVGFTLLSSKKEENRNNA
jgi:hypothetical protein